MTELLPALVNYVRVLSTSAQNTSRAEDRSNYSNHLAAAALMFMHVLSNDVKALKSLVSSEQRAYGWGYLSDSEGSAAERAFVTFSALAETVAAQPIKQPDAAR